MPAWDDELESLANKVADLFGHQALAEAYLRAVRLAPASPLTGNVLDDLRDDPEQDVTATKVVDGRALQAAVKTELRRLVTPH